MNIDEEPEMAERQLCHWYLAFIASRTEQRVKRELDQRKVWNYLSLRKITYQWQGCPEEILLSQIARCIPTRASESDVLQSPGIQGLVISRNVWGYRIPEWQVSSCQLLFSHVDTAVKWIPDCPELAPIVCITRGSLNELVGELDTPETEIQIMTRSHVMGCLRITIPGEWIERLQVILSLFFISAIIPRLLQGGELLFYFPCNSDSFSLFRRHKNTKI